MIRAETSRSEERNLRRLVVAATTTWVVLLVYAAVRMMRPWPDVLFGTDFISFWSAAAMIREGASSTLFDLETQRSFQTKLHMELSTTDYTGSPAMFMPYLSPPPLAILYLPLTLVPLPWGYALWFGISLAMFLAAIALALQGAPFGRSHAALMLTFGAVTTTLLEGQPYGLFLLVFTAALRAMASGQPALGGALLGLLWLKPQYAVLLPLIFLVKARWHELGGMAAAGLILAALSLAMVGPAGMVGYLAMFQQTGIDFPAASPLAMVNGRALLLNLWPGMPKSSAAMLVVLLGGTTTLVSLLAWRGRWDAASPRFPRQMLAAMGATLFATPHSHFHGTVLLLAPLAMITSCGGERAAWAWRPLLVMGYVLALVVALYSPLRWLMAPYLMLAMGLLILQSRCDRAGMLAQPRQKDRGHDEALPHAL